MKLWRKAHLENQENKEIYVVQATYKQKNISFLILIFLQISKGEKILCISRPEKEHSIGRKY